MLRAAVRRAVDAGDCGCALRQASRTRGRLARDSGGQCRALATVATATASSAASAGGGGGGFSYPTPRRLDQIVRLDKFAALSAGEAACAWREYHAHKPGALAAVLPLAEYARFVQRAARYPMFVYPVLRPGGAFLSLLGEAQGGRHVLFTFLQEYRDKPAAAQPRLLFTLYDELLAEKEMALLRAEIVHQEELSEADAQRVLHMWRRLYTSEDGSEGAAMVRAFHERPGAFSFDRALELASKS